MTNDEARHREADYGKRARQNDENIFTAVAGESGALCDVLNYAAVGYLP